MLPGSVRGKRFAVVGSGVSGVSSAWLLQHHGAVVTLFESEPACGGHTYTYRGEWDVDLGFQVYNLSTYAHFVGWLELLGVESEPSDMSFSLSVQEGQLEWASHSLNTIFAQRKNLCNVSFLRMVWDVLRFGREAPQVLNEECSSVYQDMSLGEYLHQKGCAASLQAWRALLHIASRLHSDLIRSFSQMRAYGLARWVTVALMAAGCVSAALRCTHKMKQV
jgi:predicted NAD/FAD-binding protein